MAIWYSICCNIFLRDLHELLKTPSFTYTPKQISNHLISINKYAHVVNAINFGGGVMSSTMFVK